MKLIGYYRVSTDAQGESGLGLEAQQAAVRSHVALRGDELIGEVVEVASGGRDDREALAAVLARLARGEADGLIVAKLDRLARSIAQVDRVLDLSQRQGWRLVALDLGVDTDTASGRLVVNVLAAVAQWERETIGERTRDGLAAKREREGGRLKGNKPSLPAQTVARIRRLRARGLSLRQIARELEQQGVETAQGGRWHAGTVAYVLDQP